MMGCKAGVLVTLWAASAVWAAEPPASPYQGIVDRNVFGLKAPPPPPDPEATKPPPRKITLQGIITLLDKKLALMKVMAPPAKPGAKAEEVPLTLAVGQKSEDVEVLEIHEDEPKFVKVNNSGTITNLNFKDNGVNLASAAPAAGAPPGVPPRPGGVPPPFNPAAAGNPAAYNPRAIPRTSRMNTGGGAAYNPGATPPNVYSAVPNAPVTSTPGTVALSGLGAPPSPVTTSQNWPPETPMAPEQAAAMELLYSQKYQKEIQAGTMPSIPGTENYLPPGNNPTQQKPTQSRF